MTSSKKTQIDKFREAARQLETNDDPAAFDRKMKRMKLKTKPSATPVTKKPRG